MAHGHLKFLVAHGHLQIPCGTQSFTNSLWHTVILNQEIIRENWLEIIVAHGHLKFSVARGHLKFSVAHGHLQITCGTLSF